MAKNLVIVESPTKVKTIKKFLGKNYEVAASNGHVRDLPKSQLGFSPENDFEPKYITIRGKGDVLANLRKEAKKADRIYLATDPDREGEAISWHLLKALDLDESKAKRITFNEITKNAVKSSLKNPRPIDSNLVDAQQARRMLDRMVGYEISPLLWEKVKRGLSAGRVQSAALRIICDKEEEISDFIPEEYWTLTIEYLTEGGKKPFSATLTSYRNKKLTVHSKEEMDRILAAVSPADDKITDVKTTERVRKSPNAFTTSTLQQEASKQLNFSTQKTMRIAQQLYEGIDIKGNGTVGLITYLRTDSTRVSEEAKAMAKDYIIKQYGEEYLAGGTPNGSASGRIQDAHEAIRPSDIMRTPARLKDSLSRDQLRLYTLIWNRFAASQMANARYEHTVITIESADYQFSVTASKPVFDGYLAVYHPEEGKTDVCALDFIPDTGTVLTRKKITPAQHFTQPPAHFTEASLVRTLEELGIGRPSTYAPTISTLLGRHYIIKENRNLFVSELGEAVNSIMKDAFPVIVDERFTANMESLLDGVEEGMIPWKTVVRNFYPDLMKSVQDAQTHLQKIEIRDEVTDVICEECGRNMVIKYGPHGRFLACPGFPECRNTKPYYEKVGVPCPACGKDIVLRKTKKGRKFYGCENYPECGFMSWQKPSKERCPDCGNYMLEKGTKLVCSDPACGYVADLR